MKIVAISDTHGFLPILPKCDVVCICGDISPLDIQSNKEAMGAWLKVDFYNWVKSLRCDKVILIAGNHDRYFERHPEAIIDESQDKLIILKDSSITFKGIKFYGTPWCPDLKNWAFYKNHEDLVEIFSKIPNDVDVLLTHCPPKIGTLGVVLQKHTFNTGCNYGCQELADAILDKKPNYALSGHVHSGNHNWEEYEGVKLINVSLKDEFYNVTYLYTEFNI